MEPTSAEDLEEASRQLYGAPLDRFIAERDALAARLRSAGLRAPAAEVRKLRKPSIAAWAVNQLVRRNRQGVEELIATSAQLRDAHASGTDAATLRRLSQQRRATVGSLTEQARGLLAEAGLAQGPVQLDRVTNTLLALTIDEQGEARLIEGCLEREEAPSGFGGALTQLAPEAFAEPDASEAAEGRAQAERLAEAERLAAQAREAEREADRLEAIAQQAERAATRARRAADIARGDALRARQAAEAALDTSP